MNCNGGANDLPLEPERAARNSPATIAGRDSGLKKDPHSIRQRDCRTSLKLGEPADVPRGCALLERILPKSWRHTFATPPQEANVDLLIRQLTLGHQPMSSGIGALGMTTVYTHPPRNPAS